MPVVTQAELDAIAADQHALANRIDALTMPVTGESPDGTRITPVSISPIVDSHGWKWAIIGGQMAVDGVPVANTHGVVEGLYDEHQVYQKNTYGDWWGPCTKTDGGPHLPGDPSVVVPPTPAGVPPMAAAVGYTRLAFGPKIIIGDNWRLNAGTDNVTQHGDGVVCAGGSNGYNAHLRSNAAFANGAFFEAELFWTGVYNGWGMPGSTGWPSFWANDVDSDAGLKTYSAEYDFMEYWGDTKWGAAIHAWYGGQGNKLTVGSDNVPSNFDHTKPHKYGALWVPATSTTRGYSQSYFDRTHIEPLDITWAQHTNVLPPIDVSVIDTGRQGLILGSGAGNPMTVLSVSVWQKP